MGNLSADVPCVGCAEAPLVVVPGKGILHCPAEPIHMQAVIVCLVLNAEDLVEGVLVLAVPVLQVNAKRVVSLACHLVDVLVAQPELTIEVPKALLVLIPGPVEIN